MLKKIFGFTAMAALAAIATGCARNPTIDVSQLQDPRTTPHEKWSDAMHVADAMQLISSFGTLYDVPRNLYEQMTADTSVAQNAEQVRGSIGTAAVGAVGGGPAAGVGLGIAAFSLIGGVDNRLGVPQVVAFVPKEDAKSLKEAMDVAMSAWDQMRVKAFPNSTLQPNVKKYPVLGPLGTLSTHLTYERAIEMAKTNPVTAEYISGPRKHAYPRTFPGADGEHYGPIYIYHELADYLDPKSIGDIKSFRSGGQPTLRYETVMSQNLPEWFFIYKPGRSWRKAEDSYMPRIFNQGQIYEFIGK